jgi:hypothetical protein
MKSAKSLPFICRLEDATTGKTKQNLSQFGNSGQPVKAKR